MRPMHPLFYQPELLTLILRYGSDDARCICYALMPYMVHTMSYCAVIKRTFLNPFESVLAKMMIRLAVKERSRLAKMMIGLAVKERSRLACYRREPIISFRSIMCQDPPLEMKHTTIHTPIKQVEHHENTEQEAYTKEQDAISQDSENACYRNVSQRNIPQKRVFRRRRSHRDRKLTYQKARLDYDAEQYLATLGVELYIDNLTEDLDYNDFSDDDSDGYSCYGNYFDGYSRYENACFLDYNYDRNDYN